LLLIPATTDTLVLFIVLLLLVGESTIANPEEDNTCANTFCFNNKSEITMFKKVPASSLYVSDDIYWLESRFHFSFADYFDPHRQKFGVLRVVNDDLVIAKEGFSTHPHRDMEIITYVIDGQLTHKDSMGTKESLSRGSVQYMSAGTGVSHSEYNDHNTDRLRFLQIWILPDKKGHKPRYGSKTFPLADRLNKIKHLVGFENVLKEDSNVIPIHQDANILVSELEVGKDVSFTINPQRQAYLVCIEGSMSLTTTNNGREDVNIRDGLQIVNKENEAVDIRISNTGNDKSHFLMIEMARSEN